ncbi:protein fem-1 homolog A-like [Mytilus trossulus]|uniref:protein fem-1 homolog A-like n=1 Tax=Mytilus trossulus TaxID=6551 RepID=UPI003007B873
MPPKSNRTRWRGVRVEADGALIVTNLDQDIMASWDERKIDLFCLQKLLTAAENGNIKEVELCVKNRANLECRNSIGLTPLMLAAKYGHLEVVTYLVTHGSQLEATSTLAGLTPLMLAAKYGHLEVVTYLVTHGSQLEATSTLTGMTPLMWAAVRGHLEVVTYLVTHGSQLDATSKYGETALHHAAQFGGIDVTKCLVDQGCSPWVKSLEGKTPYDLVKIDSYDKEEGKRKKEEVMDFLKLSLVGLYKLKTNKLKGDLHPLQLSLVGLYTSDLRQFNVITPNQSYKIYRPKSVKGGYT